MIDESIKAAAIEYAANECEYGSQVVVERVFEYLESQGYQLTHSSNLGSTRMLAAWDSYKNGAMQHIPPYPENAMITERQAREDAFFSGWCEAVSQALPTPPQKDE